MLSTVLYYELAMKVPIPVGITVYLLTWGLGHLRCLVIIVLPMIRKTLQNLRNLMLKFVFSDFSSHLITNGSSS